MSSLVQAYANEMDLVYDGNGVLRRDAVQRALVVIPALVQHIERCSRKDPPECAVIELSRRPDPRMQGLRAVMYVFEGTEMCCRLYPPEGRDLSNPRALSDFVTVYFSRGEGFMEEKDIEVIKTLPLARGVRDYSDHHCVYSIEL